MVARSSKVAAAVTVLSKVKVCRDGELILKSALISDVLSLFCSRLLGSMSPWVCRLLIISRMGLLSVAFLTILRGLKEISLGASVYREKISGKTPLRFTSADCQGIGFGFSQPHFLSPTYQKSAHPMTGGGRHGELDQSGKH